MTVTAPVLLRQSLARKQRDQQITSQADLIEAQAQGLARTLQRLFERLAAELADERLGMIKVRKARDSALMRQAQRVVAQQALEMFGTGARRAGSNLGTLTSRIPLGDTPGGRALADRLSMLQRQLADSVTGNADKILGQILEQRGTKPKRELAREYEDRLRGSMTFDRAITWARTEAAVATNTGAAAAYQAAGIEEIEWMAFKFPIWPRRHDEMDGKRVAMGDWFELPSGARLRWPHDPLGPVGEVVNCFLPDVRIAGEIVAALRSWFDGQIVRIQTARGWTAVTPNHPIPTRRGWLAAHEVQHGDRLIGHRFDVEPISANHDDEQRGLPAAQVFKQIARIGASMRLHASALDLHGDATAGQQIDVVTVDGDLGLEPANLPASRLGFADHLDGRRSRPLAGLPGASALPLDGLSTSTLDRGPLQGLRFGATAGADACLDQATSNGGARETERIRESLLAHPGVVSEDEILRVDVVSYSGHVYDFQSQTGLLWGNGILHSNCRCSHKPVRKRRTRTPPAPTPARQPPPAAVAQPATTIAAPRGHRRRTLQETAFDQQRFRRSAEALAAGNLDPQVQRDLRANLREVLATHDLETSYGTGVDRVEIMDAATTKALGFMTYDGRMALDRKIAQDLARFSAGARDDGALRGASTAIHEEIHHAGPQRALYSYRETGGQFRQAKLLEEFSTEMSARQLTAELAGLQGQQRERMLQRGAYEGYQRQVQAVANDALLGGPAPDDAMIEALASTAQRFKGRRGMDRPENADQAKDQFIDDLIESLQEQGFTLQSDARRRISRAITELDVDQIY